MFAPSYLCILIGVMAMVLVICKDFITNNEYYAVAFLSTRTADDIIAVLFSGMMQYKIQIVDLLKCPGSPFSQITSIKIIQNIMMQLICRVLPEVKMKRFTRQ